MPKILGDCGPERGNAVIAKREPELESTEAARQFDRLLEESKALHWVVAERPRVVTGVGKRRSSRLWIAVEEKAAVKRLVEPFMGIERDRIRLGESSESFWVSHRRGAPVRAVHVEPQIVFAGDLGER